MRFPLPPAARRALRLGLSSVFALWGAGLQAQAYGQWSWDASAGVTGRHYRNLLDRVQVSRDDETDFGFELGLNGFILHPAVAQLRLSGDLAFSSYSSTRSVDQWRWGLGGSLNVLPYGNTPLSVYGNRQVYDFTHLTEDDPLNLLGIPDSAWTLGSRLRLRSGLLRGTRLGFDHTETSFVGTQQGKTSLYEIAFGEWSRSSRTVDQRLYLERLVQDYATVGYRTRDLRLNYDLRAVLSPRWRWEMFATGLHRGLDYSEDSDTYDSGRTSQRFILEAGQRRTLELAYEGGLGRDSSHTEQTHLVQSRYRFWPKPDLLVGPFVGWGVQLSDGRTTSLPQAGVSSTWSRRLGSLDFSTNGTVSGLWVSGNGPASSALGLGLGATLGQGEETGLRRDLELAWARNRVRVAGDTVSNLPDLGVSLGGSSTEDLLTGRLTLRRRWRGLGLHSFTDGSRREGRLGAGAQPPLYDTLSETLQLTSSRLTLTGSLSGSRVRRPTEQSLSSWYASLTWRPLRSALLTGSYRRDRRELTLAPRLDGERWEAQADLRVGAFILRGLAFESHERSEVVERTNRGLIVSLARNFAGWLPIVTGPPAGGSIQ